MPLVIRDLPLLQTAAVLAALLATSAHAEDVPWPPDRVEALSVATVIAQPLPRRFCLAGADKATLKASFEASLTALLERDVGELPEPFTAPEQTDGALERLIASRRLPLLTLMKTESTDVFFGINERGRLGVHFDASALMDPE